MNHKNNFCLLLQHSHHLRCLTDLAKDRFRDLLESYENSNNDTTRAKKEKGIKVQLQTANNLGGLQTRMLFEASREIEKFHLGPLQLSYCALYAIIEKYEKLVKQDQIYKDDGMDKYCTDNAKFLRDLKLVRNSILHQRIDNLQAQERFVNDWSNEAFNRNMLDLLFAGLNTYEQYLRKLHKSIKRYDNDRKQS